MEKTSAKKIALIVIAIIVVICIIAFIAIFNLRVDSAQAMEIALEKAGGGEVISEEISSEGLWNEYSYVITNGDKWYDIEISGFGNITEMESGTGQYLKH